MNQDNPQKREKYIKQKFPYLDALFTGNDKDSNPLLSILKNGIQQEKKIRGLF